MLQKILKMRQHLSAQHRIVLKGKATPQIYGDCERLQQWIKNLLSNAIKYSLKSEIIRRHRGKLWVESTLHEGSVFHYTLQNS